MPWWAWIVAVVAALLVLMAAAMRAYRAGIRRKVLDELGRAYPDLRVVEEGVAVLKLASPKMGEIELRLGGLYAQCAQAKDDAARDALVRRFLASLHENAAALGTLSMAEHGDRLLPRLAPADFLRELPKGAALPHRPLGDTGLLIVYVIDRPRSVEYVSDAHLKELGIDAEALHARAMDNLRKIADARGDGHDAARLLLVPERLAPGTSTTAAVPDANTLALGTSSCPPPGAKPLLPGRLLRVTPEGVIRM
jgi:hypothetical protein